MPDSVGSWSGGDVAVGVENARGSGRLAFAVLAAAGHDVPECAAGRRQKSGPPVSPSCFVTVRLIVAASGVPVATHTELPLTG